MKNHLEYIPLRLAVALVDVLPVGVGLALGRAFGSAAYATMPRRRKIAIANILAAGCADDSAAASRMARESFRSFGMVLIESLAASRIITPETVDNHIIYDWPEETRALVDEPGRAAIVVGPHVGNWEVCGHSGSLRKKVTAVARGMNNPLVQRFLEQRNPRRNLEIVGKHSGGAALHNALRNGRILAIVCDQHASGNGVVCDFLGRPAKTVTSPARLHQSTGAPIVCACAIRTGKMKFKITVTDSVETNGASILEITEEINRRFGEFIRACPSQYLWSHNRWRA